MRSTPLAIILPHGVLFRGGAEEKLRRKLLDDGHIDTVIGLPANLFYSTGIQVCILILKKGDGDPQQRGIRHGCLEKIPVRHDAPQRQSPGRVFRGSARPGPRGRPRSRDIVSARMAGTLDHPGGSKWEIAVS